MQLFANLVLICDQLVKGTVRSRLRSTGLNDDIE